jgi:hypothetical protein
MNGCSCKGNVASGEVMGGMGSIMGLLQMTATPGKVNIYFDGLWLLGSVACLFRLTSV